MIFLFVKEIIQTHMGCDEYKSLFYNINYLKKKKKYQAETA